LQLPSPWPLELGDTLADARLAYELTGPAGAPLVIVLGGISSGRHLTATDLDPTPGWWQPLVGPGHAVDTRSLRVLGVDFLGGSGVSSRPPSCDASTCHTASPPGAHPFPSITTTDQARALAYLLWHLGVQKVVAFVGSSYGGMVALAFGASFPEQAEQLVVISASARSHPQATAWRSLQRKIVRLGQQHGVEKEGLSLSRALAMTTYRTPEEFAERFDAPPKPTAAGYRFPVEDYLEARGETFANVFDAGSFLCLSESIDLHRIDPRQVTVPTTLVAVNSDRLVPCSQMEDLHRQLAGPCRLEVLDSLYGHDAFLKETDALEKILCRSLGCESLKREVA
jgi:homoserine O-acetyltransferase